MALPVALGDLVLDQRIARLGIGNSQQRLGEAHQRNALLARQRILVHQPLNAGALVLGPERLDQLPRGGRGLALLFRRHARRGQQRRQAVGFRCPAMRGYGASEVGLQTNGRGEIGEQRARMRHRSGSPEGITGP